MADRGFTDITKTEGYWNKYGRIKFVEPNDVFGYGKNQDDIEIVPLTPDYEDLCIAFNLIIETYNRLDNQERNEIGLMWTDKLYTTNNSEQDSPYVSVVDGGLSDGKGNRFLSTYYTEISSDGYRKKEMMEGLGVESIQVSFDSYFTPTVQMKLIDVRGSALFGREEAIHSDKKGTGRINGGNIFGAFMTQPYPKFRLQMKGFYGKDVTYQLTVSNFTANFNAKTGNVEANVSFVGYTWSLLTDIPLTCLIAAPYCNYVGKKYWDDHCGTIEWQMNNSDLVSATSTQPPRLADFFTTIQNCIKDATDNGLLSNISDDTAYLRSLLERLSDNIKDYMSAKNREEDENCGQLYDRISSDVNEYSQKTNSFLDLPEVTKKETDETYEDVENSSYLNWTMDNLETPPDDYITKIVSQYETLNQNKAIYGNSNNFDINNLKIALTKQSKYKKQIWYDFSNVYNNAILKSTYTLIGAYVNVYNNIINYENISKSKKVEKPIYPDLSNLQSQVNDKKLTIEEDYAETIENANREFVVSSLSKIQIDPNIYNIFKILMCHLETFVHILFEAGKEIKEQQLNGLRTPTALGVELEATDLPSSLKDNNFNLPAWTMITNKNGNNINDENKIEYTNAYKWVGSLKGGSNRWVEERVVWSLQNAIQQALPSNQGIVSNTQNGKQTNIIPILPNDSLKENGFKKLNNTSFDGICGNLGIRMAQLLGVMDNDADSSIVRQLGEIDAYNYYLTTFSIDDIKSKILENVDDGDAADLITNIITANTQYINNYGTHQNNDGSHSYIFEDIPLINGRQPIFVKEGNAYKYSYMPSENGYIIPADLISFDNNNTYTDFATFKNGKFVGNVKNDEKIVDNWLYSNDKQNDDHIIFNQMFSVVKDEDTIGIIDWYNKIKNGNFKVKGYTVDKDYNNLLRRYWKVGYEDYKKRTSDNLPWTIFGLKVSDRKNIIAETTVNVNNEDKWKEIVVGNSDNSYPNFKMGNDYDEILLNNTSYTIKNLYATLLGVYDTRGLSDYYSSLFGHPFYYEQNRCAKNLSGQEANEARVRTLESKAFLFLQSLPRTNTKFNYEFNNHGGYSIWSKVNVLYLGGLLYRQDYYDKHGEDLIQYGNKYFSCVNNKRVLTIGNNLHLCVPATSRGISENSSEYLDYNTYVGSINENIRLQLINEFKKFATDRDGFVKFNSLCELKGRGNETISGDELLSLLNDSDYNIISHNSVYDAYRLTDRKDSVSLVFKQDDNTDFINNFIRNVCFGKAIIVMESKAPYNNDNGINIDKSKVETYLNTFIQTLRDIHSSSTTAETEYSSTGLTDNIDVDENVLLSIYTYCKNIWEKWLLPLSGKVDDSDQSENYYDVKRFFKNFVFVDTYYNEIGTKLKVNLDVLYKKYIGRAEKGNLFSFIGDIVGEHRCLFVGLPDYIDLGLGIFDDDKNEDEAVFKQRQAIENMKKIFTPIPYSKMGIPRSDNHFVVMYTYPPASKMPEEFSYRYDGFDIWSVEDDEELSGIFKCVNKKINDDGKITQFGYNIPAFGVAFGRQNNHLFKDFVINMSNPVQTEQSLKALQNICELAKGDNRKVCFYGQDIYNIYSNYSYQIEVEMMGNAQIQPLMYFQLSNIPMWRGMYMIFNVTHTMTAGNMVTKFKGMKMTRYPVPYLSKYWSFIKNQTELGNNPYSGDWSGYSNGINLRNSYSPSRAGYKDEYNKFSNASPHQNNWGGGGTIPELQTLYNKLYDEIAQLPENTPTMKWNIAVGHDKRVGGKNASSCHLENAAMDLGIQYFDSNGNPTEKRPAFVDNNLSGSKPCVAQPEMFIVLDIIANLHMNEIHEAILEYWTDESMQLNDGKNFAMLHLSCKHGNHHNEHILAGFQREPDSRTFTAKPNRYKTAMDRLKHIPSSFHQVAYKAYLKLGASTFKKHFTNYSDVSDDDLNKFFSGNTDYRENGSSVSIFTQNKDYNKNVFLLSGGNFTYTYENMKKGVLYFVAQGEGGNRNVSGNHSTDYCGINERNTTFYTSSRARILNSTKQGAFVADFDNDVFNFYYREYYYPYRDFLTKCRNPYTRYMGVLAIKAGSGFYEEGFKRVGGKDFSKLDDITYTSTLGAKWEEVIRDGYDTQKGYGSGNKAYWNSVANARNNYNKIL